MQKHTHGADESISSAESKLAKRNLEKIMAAKILTVTSVASDASAQLAKVVRDHGLIKHCHCFVHMLRTRTLQKKDKKILNLFPFLLATKPCFFKNLPPA